MSSTTDIQIENVTKLTLLPENGRYFQYRGLPCVLFWGTHHWGWNQHPGKRQLEATSAYANFITLQATHFRNSDYRQLWERIQDPDYWREIAASVEAACELDLVTHLYFFDGNYSIESGRYWDSDEFKAMERLDEPLTDYGLAVSRRDIHLKVIEMAAEHLWRYPNVIFDPAFEITDSFRRGTTSDAFCKWWVEAFKAAAGGGGPEHLFGTMRGGEGSRLERRGMDLIIGEHRRNDFSYDPREIKPEVYRYGCPLVRMALREPETWDRETLGIGHPGHELMVEQILSGVHTAEDYNFRPDMGIWGRQAPELDAWFLQARWFLENIATWEREPGRHGGDEIIRERLPIRPVGKRPRLDPADGAPGGFRRQGEDLVFEAVFADEMGRLPAQAEVWADLNGDGRFDPHPEAGERLALDPVDRAMADARRGVRYRSKALRLSPKQAELRFVFRFAGADWQPPRPGPLAAGESKGVSYRHWIVDLATEGARSSV